MSNLISISKASELLGVLNKTLRRWESQGKIKSYRTEGKHRRYDRCI
jgi:excisionase family DNA binding protein